MGIYTTYSQSVICPYWNVKVELTGWYLKSKTSSEIYFSNSTCSVLSCDSFSCIKQEISSSYYGVCELCPCDLLNTFPKVL